MSTERFISTGYSNFSHGSPELETAQISMNRRMDGQIVVSPYHGILLKNTKEINS